MSFAKEFQQIFAAVKEIIDTKHVKDQVIDEARKMAADTVSKVLEHSDEPFPDFPRVDFISSEDRDEFLLVLEFLQSSGNIFGAPILTYESQHPEVKLDRADLARRLGLNEKNPEPLLIQIVRSHMEWLNSKNHNEEED
ncbi:hypothetical protein TRFO_36459 [Tritrichomonas foetus]|uniref:Uncharacterized protein n=1 Tax=Tritrichomonas foetus TaxID=1144522 RepID=A0A1J4JE24_9EUKA|nr:hypothetical protein TRFO_36459 [Tritrichomonas foetus]|eukprot:OHS97360.1 hypothetical protein TRFO_36459 [Tritrichomonas foetus]